MDTYIMTEAENLLAELIWEREPIGSGELVKLASQRLGWRKATTYRVLHRICENNIFQNKAAVVTSKKTREEYMGRREERDLKENSDSAQPVSTTGLLKRKKRSKNEIEELVKLIEEYED